LNKSYAGSWELNKAPAGGMVVEVVNSKNADFEAGDLAMAWQMSWKLFQVVPAAVVKTLTKIPAALKGQASYFIGACGMPGLSALLPLKHFADAKAGETAFVSGAAGAVGSVVGQLLKLQGLTVIGSAGSDDKVDLLKNTLGFDHSFNYNKTDLNEKLKEIAPNGIDVFFDNVGGPTLETLLNHMKKHGRIILCGSISNYNKGGWEASYGVRSLMNVTVKSLKIYGFIVSDWPGEFKEGTEKLVGLVRDGKLKVQETIMEGFDNVPKAFIGLFSGANTGKMVIKV